MLLILIISYVVVSNAADHYVRDGASGSADGSDWTNAWDEIPASLTRGDTYFIADGTYGGIYGDDAESGTTIIHIKKAISTDHGTETGWESSYGDGQADLGEGITFSYGFYNIDGQVGGGPDNWKTGHGFKMTRTMAGYAVDFRGPGTWNATSCNNITFSHIEFEGRGSGIDAVDRILNIKYVGTDGSFDGHQNVTVEYCYLHSVSGQMIHMDASNNFILQYSCLSTNTSTATNHGEGLQINCSGNGVARYNLFEDIEGSGIFGFKTDSAYDDDEWDIYGNVMMYSQSYFNNAPVGIEGIANGVIMTDSQVNGTSSADNIRFYNNSIIRVRGTRTGCENYFGSTTSINNVWYDCVRSSLTEGSVYFNSDALSPHSYNSFVSPEDTTIEILYGYGEGNDWLLGTSDEIILEQSSPFTAYLTYDFTLISGSILTAGTSLGSPYNVDMFGNTRGEDGTWDRGAIEYVSGLKYLIGIQ